MKQKILLLDIAALGYDFWKENHTASFWEKLSPKAIETIFPALTCTIQATLRTGILPEQHGLFFNGRYDPVLKKAQFWEQSSALFQGERIWKNFRANGGTVGQICFQQSLGEDVDLVLSPAPIHKHHGGMIQDCYTQPPELYSYLCKKIKRPFNLFRYWGPFTSIQSTQWIVDATCEVMQSTYAPDVLLTYLPHLDYDQQRYGSQHPKSKKAFLELESLIEKIIDTAKQNHYEVIIVGDYAITPTRKPIYLNRILRENKLLTPRFVQDACYLDLWKTPVFAVVDHQVAHIVVNDSADTNEVKQLLESIDGVKRVFRPDNFPPNDWLVESNADAWFAYPWWNDNEKAPDYAYHVDIHNKPGFDPCELFMDFWPLPPHVSQKATRIGGTHGVAGENYPVLIGSTLSNFQEVKTILDVAKELKKLLDSPF